LLAAAGIPVHGCRQQRDGTLSIDFRDEASESQRTQAAALLATFDPQTEATSEARQRLIRESMTPAGFERLNGVQKLEAMRAALEYLLNK
jgi:hypothetical protein